MKQKIIIADSGGTKTDWCFIDEFGLVQNFSTCSYHPRMLNDQFKDEAKQFWVQKNMFDYLLFFFGAGCLNETIKEQMLSFFYEIGFTNVNVQSDIIGAGLALNGGNGWGAICGTGSVVFELKNGSLNELRGGLGRDFGDEGSGYFFGKLVVEAFQKNELSKSVILQLKNCDMVPEFYAQIPFILKEFKYEECILKIHEVNVRLFRNKYLSEIDSIGIVGSYAFHHQEIFQRVFLEQDIQITSLLERPISALLNHIIYFS